MSNPILYTPFLYFNRPLMNVSSCHTLANINYREAEEAFTHLLQQADLDQYVSNTPECLELFEHVLGLALVEAFEDQPTSGLLVIISDNSAGSESDQRRWRISSARKPECIAISRIP